MRGLRVIWVGRTERGFVADGVRHYAGRVRTLAPLTLEEARAGGHSGRDAEAALAREADALERLLHPQDTVVLLDEGGEAPDSRGFAAMLSRLDEQASRPLTLLVGGAYGVHQRVRARAAATVALSRLTLPHQLVRLVLLEQVYRALSLLAGHGYHHD